MSGNSFYKKVEKAATVLATQMALLAGFLLVVPVVVTAISIVGRAILTIGAGIQGSSVAFFAGIGQWIVASGIGPVPGDYEIAETLIGLSIFAFFPYCQLVRGNVGVDLFVIPFGNKPMNFTQFLGDIVITGLSFLITWRHVIGTFDKYESNETSFILGFPIWWGFAAAIVFLVGLCFISLFTLWRDIRDLRANTTFQGTAGGH